MNQKSNWTEIFCGFRNLFRAKCNQTAADPNGVTIRVWVRLPKVIMPESFKPALLSLVGGAIGAAVTVGVAWGVMRAQGEALTQKVTAHEIALGALRADQRTDRDALLRLEGDVRSVLRSLERIERKLP